MTGKKLFLAIAVLVGLFGCNKVGPIKSEKAEVIQLAYIPETNGSGIGMTTGGNLAITSVQTEEVYAVVFLCKDHGKTFALRGKEIYDNRRVGEVVELKYVEILNSKNEVVDYETREVIGPHNVR